MLHLSTQPCKGTRDFLPEEMSVRTQIFQNLFNTAELFGFTRYDGPILEPAAIYEAKSGGEIADKQMYRLIDKGGRELALRPEMTPSVARMVAGHQNEITFPARWYCHANCFRYERPQRGRVREHWQLNVDIFGSEDISAELEIFDLIAALMKNLGADPSKYIIRVNDRTLLQAALINYVKIDAGDVSAVSKVIDRWEKEDESARQEALAEIGLNGEQIGRLNELVVMDLDAYCEAAGAEAAAESRVAKIIKGGLSSAPLNFDPVIVRGFDYYTSTVFEVFDRSPENRRSLFGGGRYDNLAALFTDRRITGIGFGMGDVTAWNFLEHNGLLPAPDLAPDVYVFATKDEYIASLRRVVKLLRDAGVRTTPALESPSFKRGVKQADRMNARFTMIIGDDEHAAGTVTLKNMNTSEQVTVPENEAAARVAELLRQAS